MAEGVTFEFKDLFEKLEQALTKGFDRVDQQLERMRQMLDGKADIGRVAALEAKVAENEIRYEERFAKFVTSVDDRFKPLETTRTEGVALGRVGMWVIGTVGVAVFLGCMSILAAVISGGHL